MATQNAPQPQPSTDVGFYAIIGLVATIVVWLMLMPIVPSIAETTINRFHLRTRSFPQWVIQQPIPSMYNLANHYRVTRETAGGETEVLESGAINHFPTRIITFANGRYRSLHDRIECQLVVTSSYRGIRQQTQYQITPNKSGGFAMRQIDESEIAPIEIAR